MYANYVFEDLLGKQSSRIYLHKSFKLNKIFSPILLGLVIVLRQIGTFVKSMGFVKKIKMLNRKIM